MTLHGDTTWSYDLCIMLSAMQVSIDTAYKIGVENVSGGAIWV